MFARGERAQNEDQRFQTVLKNKERRTAIRSEGDVCRPQSSKVTRSQSCCISRLVLDDLLKAQSSNSKCLYKEGGQLQVKVEVELSGLSS